MQEYLIGLTEKVKVVPKSDATLSGHSATIPVSVQNSLVQDVHNLVLRVKSANPTRLMFGDSGQAEQEVTVTGGHSQTVKFTANATASGPVEVTAQLFTTDGVPYGKQRKFTVEATEITPTVMLVIMRRRPAPRPGWHQDVRQPQARSGPGGRRGEHAAE